MLCCSACPSCCSAAEIAKGSLVDDSKAGSTLQALGSSDPKGTVVHSYEVGGLAMRQKGGNQ